MRNLFAILIFIVLGFGSAFYVGFGMGKSLEPKAYDVEQEGLKEKVIIKFSHVVAENTPKGIAAQRFAQLVNEKSEGRIEVQVFPNGLLYRDDEELNALLRGDVQIIAPATSKLTDLFPEWLILDLPYLFKDENDVARAFEGPLGNKLFSTLENKGVKGLALWDNGFKQMTSNSGPLIHPDDFFGQRFRVMPSLLIESQFRKLGVTPVPTPFNDVFKNLETGKLDGQENTLSNIYSKKFYQVQKHMTISNHGYLGYAVITNEEFWNSLSESDQQIIKEAMDQSTKWLRENAKLLNEDVLKRIKQWPDIEIHFQTPEERKEWKQRLSLVYDELFSILSPDLIQEVKNFKP
ncbi:TRAP transporter substrate-binding protein [Microaerobacter geothermalis]|uniref:TRAP transporter substrate-binding protein n=1 Tax=Microaerobacter geothermalis TaxID=674972 RepID=UPI001F333799|nr:TRAP transporter substrate-binding protein [Microaerobacter geothermalis]MCF6092984.1 TRAP transporter substrate-binding protein [Microaerobacter geothermalis]